MVAIKRDKEAKIVIGVLVGIVVAVALFFIGYHAGQSPGNGLHFKVVGKCSSVPVFGGTLRAEGSGFTPNNWVETHVYRPSGVEYVGVSPTPVDVNGDLTNWSWPCGSSGLGGITDPPGKYKVVVFDEQTGRVTKPVYFTIDPAPKRA